MLRFVSALVHKQKNETTGQEGLEEQLIIAHRYLHVTNHAKKNIKADVEAELILALSLRGFELQVD